MGKDTQDVEWYRCWAKRVKGKCKQYNSGEATLTQLDATISQLPSSTMTVSCEELGLPEVEFGFGLRYGPYGRQAWMDPHQFVTLPQAFLDNFAITFEMIRNSSIENESQARPLITKLLEAVCKELRLSGFAGPNDMRMLQEATLTFYPINYMDSRKLQKVRCVGRTDYSFYFSDKEAQAISLVVLVRYGNGFSDGQILAYMAMVCMGRQEKKETK